MAVAQIWKAAAAAVRKSASMRKALTAQVMAAAVARLPVGVVQPLVEWNLTALQVRMMVMRRPQGVYLVMQKWFRAMRLGFVVLRLPDAEKAATLESASLDRPHP